MAITMHCYLPKMADGFMKSLLSTEMADAYVKLVLFRIADGFVKSLLSTQGS